MGILLFRFHSKFSCTRHRNRELSILRDFAERCIMSVEWKRLATATDESVTQVLQMGHAILQAGDRLTPYVQTTIKEHR